MVNCNPETVSTDYDTRDRLYFEPLTLEDVLGVVEVERPEGVIVQFGGQTPLKLAHGLAEAGVPLLGTPVESIHLAEDRTSFSSLLDELGLKGPPYATARGGRGRSRWPAGWATRCWCGPRTCSAAGPWRSVTRRRAGRLPAPDRPGGKAAIFLDRFLENAIEIDVDALCDGETMRDRRRSCSTSRRPGSTPATRPA